MSRNAEIRADAAIARANIAFIKYWGNRPEAVKQGFVDEIGYFEDAVKAARARAGLSAGEGSVVTYQRKPGLLDLIFARSTVPSARGVTIHLDSLVRRETPRFMYLWSVEGQGGGR